MADSEPATFCTLPPELLLLIFHFAGDSSSLPGLALLNRACTAPAQSLLFYAPVLRTLKGLDGLLAVLEGGAAGRRRSISALESDQDLSEGAGRLVRRIQIDCAEFGQKGWGQRIGRLLALCRSVESLSITGVDDLKSKFLLGHGCEFLSLSSTLSQRSSRPSTALRRLKLSSSSFRAHSLPNPPTLPPFLAGITHLRLTNLGLPFPSTHLFALVEGAPNLESLTLSSLRDVHLTLFRQVLDLLTQCSNLVNLRLGTLLSEQMEALTLRLPYSDSPASALSRMPLLSLTLTIPHLTLPLLLCLPPSLQTLIIRSPSARQSKDTSATSFAMSIDQLEEEGTVLRMAETALGAEQAGKGLREVVWQGGRAEKVKTRLTEALARAGRGDVRVVT